MVNLASVEEEKGDDIIAVEGGLFSKRRKVGEGRGGARPVPSSPVPESSAIELPGCTGKGGEREVVVACRRGSVLGTAFHPELTEDIRWHRYFVGMCKGK